MIYENKDETKRKNNNDKKNDIEETLTHVSENIKKVSLMLQIYSAKIEYALLK